MCILYRYERSDEVGEYRLEAGVALSGGEVVAVVRDDVNFGNFSWIPGVWESGESLDADELLDVTRMPAKKDVLAAMASVPTYDHMIWSEIQRVAEAAGLTGDDVLRILEKTIRGFSVSPQMREALDAEGRKAVEAAMAFRRALRGKLGKLSAKDSKS